MSERCDSCGRWKATDRQWDRWAKWAMHHGRSWRAPIWWTLDTRCLQWNDCISRDTPREWVRRDYRWWVRLMFRLPKLEARP